jgi:3-hydroxyisobutyrate dehydrogenase
MKIGFIGLGNVGGKLAGSLIRNGHDVTVRDLDAALVAEYVNRGASSAASPKELGEAVDLIITCLPSPAASAAVAEGADGFLQIMRPGQVWLEMSTTDYSEVIRLGALVEARGAMFMECPVSGGCHRADTGNIAIFAGGPRAAFEFVLPVLTTMGRRILHTGDLGTASQLKVMTNYLCTVHLVALAEALTTCKAIGLDMNTTYEAIRISSGNSFVHETESQVILNGSRDINFTMDLVSKDVGLFDKIAQAELSERIVFLGEVPAGEVHRWYQHCLLCVACPRYEPFGLTPFEAAATGCALVCSRTGAFEQLVLPGVTGELVDTGDAPGLAQAVRHVLADLPTAVQMGHAARERVSQVFSLAKEAEGIGRVYQQLFDQAPRP